MTLEEIKARVSLKEEFERRGVKLLPNGKQKWKCCCPIHKDTKPSLEIDEEKGLWHCFGCDAGGTVLDVVMRLDGVSFKDAFLKLGGDGARTEEPIHQPTIRRQENQGSGKIQSVYCYQDANGKEVFQVVRYEGKDFRQRHGQEGAWVWNLDGVERVLYHLPAVVRAGEVWITEGEKDADTLTRLGFVATCNPGGAKNWKDGYSDSLLGKDVVLCGDNDEVGREHVEVVLKSVCDKVKTSRRVEIPAPHKDVTDWVESFHQNTDQATDGLKALRDAASVFIRGVDLPVYSILDLQETYIHYIQHVDEVSLSLGKWLPSLGKIRPLVPGELVTFMADTGVGKTAILSHVAYYAQPLPVLLFEMELPEMLLFERFVQQAGHFRSEEIEQEYRQGGTWEHGLKEHWSHLYICPRSGLEISEIERILNKADLKMGQRPVVILVDYIQLAKSLGRTRYEMMANVAEGLKVMARRTQTIVVCGSQVSRHSGEEKPLGLHDAKGAGEIENSSGLVISAMREENTQTMRLKILKNTKGWAGGEIICNFDGRTMTITERARQIDPVPLPKESSPRHPD